MLWRPMTMLAALALPALAAETPPPPEEPVVTETAPVVVEEPASLEPEFVRPLVAIAGGRNDSNPIWTPTGSALAFERARGDNKEIVIARLDGSIMQSIHYQPEPAPGQSQFFFPGVVEKTSYNAGISWAPRGDRFVFMSNAGEGNYDLYLRGADGKTARLTEDKEKDGHADWSPAQDRIAFISGRSGKGDVYVLDLVAKTTTALTRGEQPYLYPQWSPDGKRLAVIRGSNENHDVVILEPGHNPPVPPKALTTWQFDDLRPVWSPDGKRIAFYTNYNDAGDARIWAIAVVAADGSDPTEGEGLIARIVATNVIADVERGPAWLPDSRRIVYARAERQSYYPIYVADVENRTNAMIRTGTTINHDLTSSRTGVIAFRAQVNQWDQIFVMKLKD